ncbi:MAG: hypothetical protein GF353_09595 [Candidatus Lokiarchaeota archaeon]|nr:hypothetical protein [Candidatus Lokiarchaeota archaeon]
MVNKKFYRKKELDDLIALIYADTRIKISKKELLETIFELGIQDYHAFLKKIQTKNESNSKDLRKDLRKEFIQKFSGIISVSNPDKINPKSIWENKL